MSPANAPTPRRAIVQCARTIGAGYGVSGPAFQLERAFTALGCDCERFTLEDLGLSTAAMPAGGPLVGLLRFWRDVLLYSTLGSLVLWRRYRGGRRPPSTVVICHVDALYGDLFVVRSLHKAFLERHPARRWMLLRNPLHLVVLARDRLRFTRPIHRHFVALSEANKAEIVRLYGVPGDRITVIPNGVDLERFQPSADHRRGVRAELGLRDDEMTAIFVGHEFERKGLRVLLEALRLLNARGIHVALLVAGREAPDRIAAEFGDLSARVRFLGHRADVERFYAAADVFVLPASFDISPLVGPEALASGLPLLMTDVGGVRDYLEDGRNGWFIEREASDIASKLARLAQEPGTRAALAARARPSVADRDWRVIAGRFLDLIDRVCPPDAPTGPT